ncbi:Serine--pyruvate aminotransferase, mitochondrial [Orchesella cincta]|uniref:Alanine--glyoxylate aminotransferase n=1 Tax=Orchesella cincta TaxID=48709 RepID=A0A1D2MSP2_ORCCI|nr:Serine--pyruvate aminotransferase, mitochondrial [Orchesella cincta]
MDGISGFAVIFFVVAGVSCYPETDTFPLIAAPESLKLPLLTGNRFLVSGGASNPSRRAFQAMQRPLLGTFENGTRRILSDIQDGLRYILQTKNAYTLAFHGTGTTALLGVLDNLIEPGDKILVGVNGHWGQIVANLSAQRFGADVVKMEKPFGTRFSLDEIRLALQLHRPDFLYLASGESTTGVYQPLEGVGELCHRYNCITIADVVATVGQQPINMDANKIDAVYMNSQKGCGGIVGLAPVSFSSRAMNKIKRRTTLAKNYQTDMNGQAKAWFIESSELHSAYVHSISLPLLYMLREGLANVADEGLENVWSRHKDAHRFLQRRAASLGLEHFVPNYDDRLVGASLYKVPAGKDAYKIQTYMLNKHSTEIYPGYKILLGKVIRFGFIGSNANRETVSKVMSALEDALASPSTDLL